MMLTTDSIPTGTVPALGGDLCRESDRAVPGRTVARYVVLEEIGRGGMGRVLRAYDPKLHREVALKGIRSATLGAAGARRLVAEARAMAKLAHPNVVAVYDVETVDADRVVLVMEYVAGQSMRAWLGAPRSWREVVACFLQAGRGLQAAHRAGLLHRDFKPDNVLVGSDGRVRVTDFGLAREAMLDRTRESAIRELAPSPAEPLDDRTASGAVAGTLPYLAPERMQGAPADEATDQFAFCVSLWEALYGRRPFAGRRPFDLAVSMSAGPPRPPSHGPRVPPWLVTAVVRGLSTDPHARWSSMDALLEALARDPARRRRRWLGVASVVVATGASLGAMRVWTGAETRCAQSSAADHLRGVWDDARRQEAETAMRAIGTAWADDAWTRTERALDDYAAAWTAMHVEACEATNVRGEQSVALMDLRMACLRSASDDLAAVSRVLAEADATTARRAHELTSSLRPLDRCADVEALTADVEPPRPEDAEAVAAARAHLARGRAAVHAGHYDAARDAIEDAAASLEHASYGPIEAELTLARGDLLDREGDYPASRETLEEALRIASRWHQWEVMQSAARELVHVVGDRLGRFDEGLRYGELALGLAGDDTVREASTLNGIGMILAKQGKYDEAEEAYLRAIDLRERALGPEHPDVAAARNNLAEVLSMRGDHPAAEAAYRQVLAQFEASLGTHHPVVAQSRNNIATALVMQDEYEAAEEEFRRALALLQAALGPDHPDVAATRHNLAGVLAENGHFEEANAENRRALEDLEKALGADHPRVAQARHNFAISLEDQGELAAAEAENRRALAVFEATLDPDHPFVVTSRRNLARVVLARGGQ